MKKIFETSQPLNCLLYVDWNVIIIYDNNKSNNVSFLFYKVYIKIVQ